MTDGSTPGDELDPEESGPFCQHNNDLMRWDCYEKCARCGRDCDDHSFSQPRACGDACPGWVEAPPVVKP